MSNKFDTSKCMFDPLKFGGSKRIEDIYPETSYYTEFTKSSEYDIKVAILICDVNSPFISIKDMRMRLIAIYDFLKMDRTSKAGAEKFKDIEAYKHTPVFEVCSLYLEMQNNHDFSAWWALSRTFYDLNRVMSTPMSNNEDVDRYVTRKLKIQKQLDEIQSALEEKEVRLFGSDKMKMASARAKMKRTRTYAEKYAMENQVM
jgi:hypothetical protein